MNNGPPLGPGQPEVLPAAPPQSQWSNYTTEYDRDTILSQTPLGPEKKKYKLPERPKKYPEKERGSSGSSSRPSSESSCGPSCGLTRFPRDQIIRLPQRPPHAVNRDSSRETTSPKTGIFNKIKKMGKSCLNCIKGGKKKEKYEKYKYKTVLGRKRVIFIKKGSKSKKEYIKYKKGYILIKEYIKKKKFSNIK